METEPNKKLSRGQKLGATALGVFVVAAMGMIVYSFVVRINRPFELETARVLAEIESLRSLTSLTGTSDVNDTDGDGINDNDELQVYNTSPYLDDTDGDGILDGEELQKGSDPNCPAGTSCADGGESSRGEARLEDAPPQLPENLFNALSQLEDPDEIRFLLSQSGVPADALAQYSDAELIVLFKQTLKESGSTGENQIVSPLEPTPGGPTGATSADEISSVLKGMENPSEVRRFLIQNGVPQNVVDGLNDEDLMESFKKTLDQLAL